ncbi:MAG: phosphate signaling complex protein PhoU [Rhizobiales bacterium]|nr:phosphate signaling complex protein PhoU [Hyphomicrobiales bacterium]NRB14351.1 phosphate signaling complex protein PhoU [Hyphomicrobiales bacterium]
MQEHIVSAFECELNSLKNKILKMGGMAESQLRMAIQALKTNDFELAKKTITADAELDKLELEIEELAILIIAKRQPMALDLRRVIVTIRISGDIERIGDLAKNLAKRVIAISGRAPQYLISGLDAMSDLAQQLLKDILNAYAHDNVQQALQVWRRDAELDRLYNSVFGELLIYMMVDKHNISFSTHLLFGAKNIERIGDHATNIAENIHYMVEGELISGERPKSDMTSISNYKFDENTDK